jgi:DNA integrity scanning protein DisA with diadenylate cyclase activity
MEDKISYSIEVREPLRGGDDYSENHHDFDTTDEVQKFIDNDLHEDEHIHSILKYRNNEMIKDVTSQFKRKRK